MSGSPCITHTAVSASIPIIGEAHGLAALAVLYSVAGSLLATLVEILQCPLIDISDSSAKLALWTTLDGLLLMQPALSHCSL